MNEYVKIGEMVIGVDARETDSLFKYLWEYEPIEELGAETDQENNFGEITHIFTNGNMIKR